MPSWTVITSPGCASSAACWIVRSGAADVPGLESLPVVATWNSVARGAGGYEQAGDGEDSSNHGFSLEL